MKNNYTTKGVIAYHITTFATEKAGIYPHDLLASLAHVNRQDADIILEDMAAAGKIRFQGGKIYKA